jgi:HEPN domain-containing protein
MTPQQLRENALNKIRSAKVLIEANSPDEAANLCGQAVEIVLKARFATRNGLADFPKDVKELKKISKDVVTHDLDALLRLAEGEGFNKKSVRHIDWERAMAWDVGQRYDPVGTTSRAAAEAQLVETQTLYVELGLYEYVEKLAQVEQQVSDELGPFIWFGLVRDAVKPREWAVVASGWWALDESGRMKALDIIRTRLKGTLDSDLLSLAPNIAVLEPRHRYLKPLLVIGPIERSPKRLRMTNNLLVGVGAVADAFLVTSYWRAEPSMAG